MIKIEVTQEDIDSAIASRSGNDWQITDQCPVALAATRAFGKPMFAGASMIGEREALSTDVCHLMPLRAQNWIKNFDHTDSKYDGKFGIVTDPVAPIKFSIRPW